jgi:acyl carrier protein
MEGKILAILKELQPAYGFEDNVDFIEMGYLDSFDVVTLVAEIEDVYSVIISALDIVPENFSSVANICNMINKSQKRNS